MLTVGCIGRNPVAESRLDARCLLHEDNDIGIPGHRAVTTPVDSVTHAEH
jgi:hypothetical protein